MQQLTFRFERLMINRAAGVFHNLRYFPQVMALYIKYLRYLEDDFSRFNAKSLIGMVEFVEYTTPHFYLVLNGDEVCGFFALEKFIGAPKNLYSAEVITCFNRKYWGILTKPAAKAFQKFCFEELGLRKIKAQVYPNNSRVKAILKTCGFKKEAVLKAETVKNGKRQDIDIYSVFKEDLCN